MHFGMNTLCMVTGHESCNHATVNDVAEEQIRCKIAKINHSASASRQNISFSGWGIGLTIPYARSCACDRSSCQ